MSLAPLAVFADVAGLSVMAVPDDEDVVAGWTAFVVIIVLVLAVAFLGFSLTKQLKKVDRAEEEGLYDPSTKKARAARALAASQQQGESQPSADHPPTQRPTTQPPESSSDDDPPEPRRADG